MRHLTLVTDIAAPIELVYDASLDVDVHMASQPNGERAVAGVTSGMMSLGDTVTWSARHFGIRWRLTSQIIVAERPHTFTDEQLRGPFARWHHRHVFERHGAGTRMTDEVAWAAPLGPLGRLVEAAALARHMERLLNGRNAYLKRLCETPQP